MQLNQDQEPTLIQILKFKLFVGCLILVFAIATLSVVYTPIKNFIRSYRPIPTSQLYHHQ